MEDLFKLYHLVCSLTSAVVTSGFDIGTLPARLTNNCASRALVCQDVKIPFHTRVVRQDGRQL